MSGETCCWKLGWPKYFGIICYSSTSYGLRGCRGASGEHLLFGLASLNDLKYIDFRLARLLFLIMLVDDWPGDLVPSERRGLHDRLDLANTSLLLKSAYYYLYGLNCKFNLADFFIASSADVSELTSLLLALIAMFTCSRVFRKGAGLP